MSTTSFPAKALSKDSGSLHSLEDLLWQGRDVQNSLFRDCSPGVLLRLSRASRFIHDVVTQWFRFAYDINLHLSHYFNGEKGEIIKFRSLQAQTGAIISGSNALQFLDRTHYPDSDMDIYMQTEYIYTLGKWLLDIGYEYKASRPEQKSTFWAALGAACSRTYTTADLYTEAILDIFDLHRNGRKIQIIAVQRATLHTILNFHSTCVMNLITYNAAYSLYARSTLEDRTSLMIGNHLSRQAPRNKYRERGWTMINPLSCFSDEGNDGSPAFGGVKRYVGDQYCWSMPLDLKGVTVPKFMMTTVQQFGRSIAVPQVSANSWRLSLYSEGDNRDQAYLSPDTLVFTSQSLKFKYTILASFYSDVMRCALQKGVDRLEGDFNHIVEELYDLCLDDDAE